ncbi:MAG TPA: TetR/AcrR family transcriptional regulator [Alphaproteobacteria bacterium]|nr:TetR/AcrR family transcriptional regulator [Alphaproteobacteria bacterium]
MKAVASSQPRKLGRPPRDEAEELTQHIVATAAALFIRGGYAGTSIEAVAQEAQVGKNTIYRRYSTKPDLFQAVVDREMEIVLPPIETIITGEDPTAILRHLATTLVEAALRPETTALQRLVIAEAERFPEIAAICIARANEHAIAFARAVLERLRKDGVRASAELDFAAEQFVACVAYGPHIYALHGRRDLATRRQIARYVERVVALFMNGWVGR